jgi:L-ascorbate metabolism protein UlaG (beta-lactamase superfamily)
MYNEVIGFAPKSVLPRPLSPVQHRTLSNPWERPALLGRVRLAVRIATGRSKAPGWPTRRDHRVRPLRCRGAWMVPPPIVPDVSNWGDSGLYAAWLGHSSVLLKIDGRFLITDPILGSRAGVDLRFCQVGIRRRVAPALSFDRIPWPDVILLSHAHMDHFDIPTLRRLAGPGTSVITALNTGDLLRARRYRAVHEVGWGQQVSIDGVRCSAFEVNHWGARYGSDRWRGYNGYVIEAGRYRVLFAGDTALTERFRAVRSSRPFDLAIMPIGAYDPNIHNHCSPEQAWKMGNDAGAERFLPVHHQTFRLGQEPYFEPITRFYEVSGSQSERIVIDRIGQQVHIS